MNYLISTTLLDTYSWFVHAPASWKERAFNGLMDTLTRAPFKPTPEISRGIAFEGRVNRLVNGTREAFVEQMGEMCLPFYDQCKGGVQQKTLKRLIRVDDWNFQLYGKTDYWFPDLTIDCKTTSNYSKGEKKYLDKSQHLLYAYMDNKPAFRYLIAVFDDKEGQPLSKLPVSLQQIDVTVDLAEAEKTIASRIHECVSFIRGDVDLKKAYLEKFNWNR